MAAPRSSYDIPESNLLSTIFSNNDVQDGKVIWRDGKHSDRALTKSQARNLTRRIAHGFVSSGLLDHQAKEAGVIILCSENQLIQFPTLLAVLAVGGVLATCPHQSSVKEVMFRINVVKPKAIICSKKTLPLIEDVKKQSVIPFQIIIQDSESMDVRNVQGGSMISSRKFDWDTTWNEEIAKKPSVLVFSSGTTGTPKGVCISQGNILSMIYQIRRLLHNLRTEEPDLKMVGVLDSAHVAGMFINTFCALGVGIENVFVPSTEISSILHVINTHQVQVMFGVPPIYTRMLDDPGFSSEALRSLKYAVTGAAKTPVNVLKAISAAMPPGSYCQQGWGMTELTFLATMPTPEVQGPWASVGRPLAGNRINILDDSLKELPASEVGEIWVSGPTVTNGYYIAPNQIHNSKQNEWLRTGDLGRVDENGYLYIAGRSKDLIKYNGAQVSPIELEDLIRQHPVVEEVGVVGMELPNGNELPTAFVVMKPGLVEHPRVCKDIADFIREQVSPYKRLRGGVHILSNDQFPKNAMGKVSRAELKKLASQMRKVSPRSSSKI